MWLSGLQNLIREVNKGCLERVSRSPSGDQNEITTLIQQGGHFVCYEEVLGENEHFEVRKPKRKLEGKEVPKTESIDMEIEPRKT